MSINKHNCIILLGSNQGWRIWNLHSALVKINCVCGLIVSGHSLVYQEKFIGAPGPDILNQVIKIITVLPPQGLLERFKQIEQQLGRSSNRRWSPRLIDIDILDYDNWIIAGKDLILPHPRLHLRPATLQGISEVSSNWIHPVYQKTAGQLLTGLNQEFTRYPVNSGISV